VALVTTATVLALAVTGISDVAQVAIRPVKISSAPTPTARRSGKSHRGTAISSSGADMMASMAAGCAFVAFVVLFMLFSYWFFRQIRDGRIHPRDDPEWGPYYAPASPRSLSDLDARFGIRPEYDDDHVRYLPEE
jgi:hypothetical protein